MKNKTIWSNRFKGKTSKSFQRIGSSINVDKRLYKQDIIASIAHVQMLMKQKIINNIDGKKIFNGSCATCHLYGTGGSTVVNDKKYWQNLIDKKPLNKIYNNVIIGFTGKKGIMPKRGGCIKCSDQDLIDAVNYIFLYNGIRINN